MATMAATKVGILFHLVQYSTNNNFIYNEPVLLGTWTQRQHECRTWTKRDRDGEQWDNMDSEALGFGSKLGQQGYRGILAGFFSSRFCILMDFIFHWFKKFYHELSKTW